MSVKLLSIKEKYCSLGVYEFRQLKQFEEERRILKAFTADLSLDKALLKDILRRNMVKAIMRNFTKFDLPIDYELAYLLMINNAIVLHKIPYIVKEGSKSFYESSIR